MTGQLNTNVNGSPGTCRDGGEWAGGVAREAESAGEGVHAASMAKRRGWDGLASEAYARSMHGTDKTFDNLSHTASLYQRKLREFGDELEVVLDKMKQARATARAGGLEVDGPFILPPEKPGPAPEPPEGTYSTNQAASMYTAYQHDMRHHIEAVADYNRKVDTFEKCRELVIEARKKEERAHADLQDALTLDDDRELDDWNVGGTAVSAIIGHIERTENMRYDALQKASQASETNKTFQQMATGRLKSVSPSQAELLNKAGERAGPGKEMYQARAKEFEKYVKGVPQNVRTALAAYPGKYTIDAKAPKHLQTVKNAGRSLPYVGSTISAFTEARGAFKAEQSWGQAGGRFAASTAGAGAFGKMGAAAGSSFGPPGAVIGGGLGVAGREVVDGGVGGSGWGTGLSAAG